MRFLLFYCGGTLGYALNGYRKNLECFENDINRLTGSRNDNTGNSREPRAGAEFALHNYDMSVRKGEDIKVSGKSGVFYIGNLPLGTYYLEETKAPSGYESNKGKYFKLEVTSEESVATDRDLEPVDKADIDADRTKHVVKTDAATGAS